MATKCCFFVTGSDEAGVKKTARALCDELAGAADAFGLETIDGATDTVEDALSRIQSTISGCQTLPFLGGEKLIWLKNASFLGDSRSGASELVQAAVADLCDLIEGGLPPGVRLLVSAPQADKRRTGFRRLKAACDTRLVDLPDLGFQNTEESLIEWVGGEMRQAGLKLTPEAVEVVTARVGLNAMQLANEIEKLLSAVSAGAVLDAMMVRELVPQTRQGGIFDLSEAILRRDLPLAMHTLDQLLTQRETPVAIILVAVVPTIRNLLLVKDLMVRHRISAPSFANQFAARLKKLPESETSHLPRKKDGSINAYPLGLAARSAACYSLRELRAGFLLCARAAKDLFGGPFDAGTVLSRLLVEILGRHERLRHAA